MATNHPDPMISSPFRVKKIVKETFDTFTLELEPNNNRGFNFKSGQFNMLYVFGIGEVPISISGDPAISKTLTHTTRAVGTVTGAMKKIKQGQYLGVRGPYGTSWPVEKSEGNDIVIVTGGIGLAPLRPAMYHVLNQREKYGNVVLLYGARTPGDILYSNEIRSWRAEFDLNVYVTVDRSIEGWRGNVGVVTTLIPKAPFDPYNATVLICGPEVMIRLTVLEFKKRGVPEDRIYISLERNMKCGIGFCGHCQMGEKFICKDGPVFRYDHVKNLLDIREV